ncbi:hypothetical protein Q4610_10820 [Sphingobium sp. HBC34]|uniref:Uncharacterized protein n=1 Tax=Sphingobium cyanobacteriorum TaxID=3063954 RepID=A0ABT8ZLW9_9SPHN|nr:hypothetical protein [Sphingobium sp. HBC34]MDO7835534.1 hypothetical protein [Sphingobium sp. HBC34]
MTYMKWALMTAAALVAMPAAPVLAQAAKTATPAARTAEPDITGVWEIYPDPFAGDENTFLELPVPNGGPRLKEPYASQWKARRADRDAKLKAGTPLADPSTLCQPEGMPSIMGAIFPLQILQTPGQVTILAEFLTQTRRILLNKTMPPDDELSPNYYGYSVGHWEGDTLVVTTRGVREDVQFFEIPHSARMQITERIRVTAPDMIENQIVIEDPDTLVEPYRVTYGYKRNDAYEIKEYLCDREDPLFKVGADGTVSMKTDAGDAAAPSDKATDKKPK